MESLQLAQMLADLSSLNATVRPLFLSYLIAQSSRKKLKKKLLLHSC